MTLPVTNVEVGEVRVDTDLLSYRWDGIAWNLEYTKTPSSATFPDGTVVGEVRQDIASGRKYQWTGSAWALNAELESGENDADQDGIPDLAEKSTNIVGGNTTTLKGSIPYNAAVDTTTMLAPNTTATKKFLNQTGTGTNGAAPVWSALVAADVPPVTNIAGANATTLKGSIPYNAAADTTTLLAPNVTVTKKFLNQTGDGTDGAAPVWSALVAADVPPVTNIAGANATTLKGSIPYNAAADTTTLLAPNVTVTKKFLNQTGDGTDGAAPVWSALVAADVPPVTNIAGGNATTLLGSIPYNAVADTTTMLAPNVTTTKKFLSETGDGTNGTAPTWEGIAAGDLPAVPANYVTKNGLKYAVKNVVITGAASGTETVVANAQILGWYVTSITGTEHVKTVDISSTTLTVTLSGSDTAAVTVVVLMD